MNLIEKTAPINEPDNKEKFCYYISDNLLDFYYTFLYRNTAAREITNKEAGLNFYQYGFISKNGFEDDVDKNAFKLFSLKDFF